MKTPFEELIRELGATLGIELHIDHHGACCLQLKDKVRVQLEPDNKEDRLILAAFIGELSPGRFREDVLKEALKANAQNTVNGHAGAILGFCARHNQLACHTFLLYQEAMGEKLLNTVTYLSEQAVSWFDALQNGHAAPPSLLSRPVLPSPFGIRP